MDNANQQIHGSVRFQTATVPYRDIPAINAVIAWAEGAGLEEAGGGASMSCTSEGGVERYKVFGHVSFKTGELHLETSFSSGDEGSSAEAVNAAVFVHGTVGDNLPPILYSKSQEELALERARRIQAELGKLAEKATRIEVPVATRAGRGGWNSKIARRHFKFCELEQPATEE